MTARSSFDQDIFIDTEELEGFATFSNKSQGIYCQVFHAKNKATGEYVYLKVLPLTFLLPRHLVNLRTEYQIVKSLTPFVPNIVSILDYRSSKSSEFLVIEDFGGESLRVFLEKDKLLFNRNVQEFLKLAITVVNTVGQIHEHHVIHKDLKPDNLMWCPSTKVVKIGDFGSATVFSGFNDSMDVNIVNRRWSDDNLKTKIEAFSFAYISPEQTGRTTNTIDYRTDFYSLGVTFFELVTGRLPFESNSRMELLHSHLAREPPSPHDIDPSHISPCLSLVILKMMAKSPDDRYQSAEGIEQDLIHCQSCMVAETHNPDHYNFIPGRYDKSRVFKIPLKLYGRTEELLSLMHAFQSASVHREPKFLMVTGSSGSGKTSLVNQLKKMPNIYFAAGKFVSSKKDVPYTATIEAIDNLIAQVLFEEESTIQSKRKLLQEQLGLNAKILVELIPSLELIIGKQTQSIIEGLSPSEMLNLLSRLFIVLLRVLSGQSTTKAKMIVLFLDDIQWADEPSLIILEALLCVKDLNLFCIAGARDNELDTMVIQRLESMKKKSIKIKSIFLSPLKISDLQELISDTLNLSPSTVEPLADLVYEKTKGNPFFVGRLLNTLFKKKLMFFDTVLKCWTWDLKQIEQIGFSDNVIELLVTALDRIPRESLDLLKLGSCFGNTFDIRHLAHLSEITTEKAEQYLFVAIRDGFIKPIDRTTFRFTHDRVQAAAYTFLDSETARDWHLKIGYYLKSLSEEEHLFSIVNHLNKVLDLILDPQDRLDLAKLNLKAGEKATLSLAYQPARSMFAAGVTLLPINSWEDHHELSFDLHLQLATTEYLCKNYTEPEHIFSLCLSHASDVFEKVRVYMYRTAMYIEKGLYGELVKIGLECLTLFDVKIPAKPGLEMVYEEISTVYKNLGTRSISDLYNLPDCSDPTIIATMVMLNKTLVAAYFTDSNLVAMLTGRMVNLSILHGNSSQSCLGYVWFGWSETIKTKRKKYCYEWGTLAIALSEKFNQIKAFPERGQVYQLFGGFVNWLNKPMTTDSEYLKKGFNYSVQVGDYPYATFAAFHLVSTSFQGFVPLPDGLEMIQPYLNFGRNGGTEDIHILSENVARCISELIGLELTISEPDFYSSNIIHRSALTRGIYHTDRMKTLYIMEDYLGAYSEGNEAKQFLGGFVGFRNLPDYYFYRTMTLLALYSMQPSDQQRLFLEEINECTRNFREYSEHCPTNFSGRNVLLEAESGRILGTMPTMDVISKFTLAAKLSEDLNFLHDMALAKELLARYFKSLSEQNFAEASFEYSKWGAVSKCNKMKLYTRRESIDVTKSKLRPQETTYFLSSEFDLEAVISASQELSSIVDVSKLCSTLLTILVKNSGATKGVLFLVREGKLVLEAASNDIQVSQGELEHASSSVVNYCWRTQKTIVVSDVMMEDPYTRDPYLIENKVCSLLCSPLIFKGEVRGVIYLENSINRGTFTDERLRIIRILGSQLLISLENAELVSRLKQNTIELQERNEALKEVDKLKDEFLAMTSHEFRTPLNGVIGMTTLLKDTQLNAEQMDYVQHINNSAESLLVLVTDILDLSRLQAQKVRLEEKPFNLVECIETAIDIVEYRGVMKGLNIACFISSNTREMLIGDRSRLKQILINLLNNGIKFTEKGEVIIKVKTVEENEEMVQVEFQVIDTGIGMKSDELELIFKPFGQIDSSYARAHTGSGLGLVICKNLCKLMNGKMWVKSDFGKGSTFGFEIPFKKYKEGQVTEKISEEDRSIDWSVYYQEMVSVLQRNISGCHVFLENHTNEFAIKSFLDPFEIPIHLYADKNSFLGSFQTNSESCIYITDAKTAETNFSAISENSIPLLVACSTLLKRPTGELYDLSNVAILKVPIRKTYLLNALYDLCKKEKRKLKMSPSNVTPEEKRMKQEIAMDMIGFNPKFCKILVVEDNLVNQKIIVKMLTKIGYQVDAADNGIKAIEFVEKNKYDAVLMDVHMPGCNGLEATSRIRKNEVKTKTHIPIIAVTASVADEIACAKAGMDDFIPKPISQGILFSKLEKWVRSV